MTQLESESLASDAKFDFGVRQAVNPSVQEVDNAAKALAEAFGPDFFTKNLLGGSEDPELAFLLQRCQIAAALVGGEVYVADVPAETGRKIVGAAVWFPPGRAMLDSDEQREAGANDFLARLKPELLSWWLEVFLPGFDELGDSAYGAGVKLQSWHLLQIGVHPAYQQRGIATALINAVKAKASASGGKLCLEAVKPLNVKIYESLGYSVRGKMTMKGLVGDFQAYAMMLDTSTANK